jgi:SAM-dependent methyltransferase
MKNPWQKIPLADYERHMQLPDVGQSSMLSDQFKNLLKSYQPNSVAVIGCAGGNGFDEALQFGVKRIIGIDINQDYLDEAKSRYEGKFSELEIYCSNVEDTLPYIAPVDIIYAALLFEYVDVQKTLANLKRICKKDGVLAILLQLPKEGMSNVSPSPYTSLAQLSSILRLVAPSEICKAATAIGFSLTSVRSITLKSQKEFSLQIFHLSTSQHPLGCIPA